MFSVFIFIYKSSIHLSNSIKIVVYIFIYIVLNYKFMTYYIESCYLKTRMSFLVQRAFCVF